MKGILTKCVFEVQHKTLFDKEIESGDRQFLQQ